MHYFGKFQDSMLVGDPLFAGHGEGYSRAPLVNHTIGSVLTGLSICKLAAGGALDPHVHSFEEGFYVLSGEAVFAVNDQAYLLKAGDYGVVKVGALHAWRNLGPSPVRWLQMNAPQPKAAGKERDTFFRKGGTAPSEAKPLDLARPLQSTEHFLQCVNVHAVLIHRHGQRPHAHAAERPLVYEVRWRFGNDDIARVEQ